MARGCEDSIAMWHRGAALVVVVTHLSEEEEEEASNNLGDTFEAEQSPNA